MIEIFILSLIQGITEFLPISSSSHLIIISEYLDFENQKLEIDVSLHIGSFIAVIVFFRSDIFNFIKNKDLFLKIIIGSIPVMVAGYLLVRFNLIDQIRNIKVIGWTTLVFGILLYISDKFDVQKEINSNFTLKSAMFIGFLQILSLIPGVSRSGITITGARILNFKRYDAAKISFLLSIPTLAAVSLFGLNNLIQSENFDFSFLILASIIFSFLFSFITIKYFLIYIKKFSLNIFVFYRIILGILILLFHYL
jgi:undecaprenyl-diphosphatase